MKVTFLGTGTSQGIPVIACECTVCTSNDSKDKRLRCAIMLTHEEKNYIIDIGPDFRAQMLTHNVKDIEAVFLTHEHNDHIIGLDDLRPFIFKNQKEMCLHGLPRVLDEIKDRFAYAFVDQKYPGAPRFESKPLNVGDVYSNNNFKIKALAVDHGNLPILGFKVNNFAYLTDVKTLPDKTKEEIRGIDHLVISALRTGRPHHSHILLDEALALVEELKPKRAYFIHMSHRLGTHEEISDLLPEHVQLAYDGLIIEI